MFKNLKNELTRFAKVLEDYKVETFILGAEYCEITGKNFKSEWKDIISSVRTTFKGKLSYGANWQEVNGKNEFYSTSFWEELDYIGLDLYSPIPDSVKGENIYNYQLNVIRKYTQFAKKYKKNLYINEVGFSGSIKGTSEPFEWRNKTPGTQERQADAYKYTLKALKSFENIKGIFIWRKLATNKYKMLEYNSSETDYDLWKRKAWYEIKNIFNSL
uniref:glycoside hydrolase family 113 n=1 Tax=Halobacteriovorax sp. TaxID=2020862 RepID=UPI0035621606